VIDPELGYDPQPDVLMWRGTPIPCVDRPLALTPERARIALSAWRWGGPEIALRNACHFLYNVIDNACSDDVLFIMNDVPEDTWRYALDKAKPGEVSRCGHRLFSLWFKVDWERSRNWNPLAHRHDVIREYTDEEWRDSYLHTYAKYH